VDQCGRKPWTFRLWYLGLAILGILLAAACSVDDENYDFSGKGGTGGGNGSGGGGGNRAGGAAGTDSHESEGGSSTVGGSSGQAGDAGDAGADSQGRDDCGGSGQPCCVDAGLPCSSGYTCSNNECVACGDNGEPCCGDSCDSGALCDGGACVSCGGEGEPCCEDETCSAAGTVCSGANKCVPCGGTGQTCCGTTCNSDEDACENGTCGSCGGLEQMCCPGAMCAEGFLCSGGECTPCGANSQTCCSSMSCNAGSVCNSDDQCEACGGVNQQCCSGEKCSAGTICSEDECVECGGSGQPCCAGDSCTAAGTGCFDDLCEPCGAFGQPCCGSICNSGLACSGSTCSCAFGTHQCATASTTTCASDTDPKNCGPGPSCFSCEQPNAVSACGSGKCNNSCVGSELCAAGADGKPSCGRWDWESGTVEGWEYFVSDAGSDASDGSLRAANKARPAWSGRTAGTKSLAIPVDATQVVSGTPTVYVRVQLCSTGQLVDTGPKEMSFHVRYEPPPTANGQIVPVLWKNTTTESTFWLNYVSPETGGGEPGIIPEGWYYDGGPMAEEIFQFSTDWDATHFGFRFYADQDWKGTIYLDDVRLE
jgi:hypothetical protein